MNLHLFRDQFTGELATSVNSDTTKILRRTNGSVWRSGPPVRLPQVVRNIFPVQVLSQHLEWKEPLYFSPGYFTQKRVVCWDRNAGTEQRPGSTVVTPQTCGVKSDRLPRVPAWLAARLRSGFPRPSTPQSPSAMAVFLPSLHPSLLP